MKDLEGEAAPNRLEVTAQKALVDAVVVLW
jgi:hypothetical protein